MKHILSLIPRKWTTVASVVALVVALLLPQMVSLYHLVIASNMIVTAILAVGLSLLVRHGGLASLGHAAYFGLGAYSVALLTQRDHTSVVLNVLAGVAIATLVALVLSTPLLRTRADYFVMATLAVAEAMRQLAISWRDVTGGDDGIVGIFPTPVLGLDLVQPDVFYYVILGALVLVGVFVSYLTSAPFGFALRAVRDNSRRAAVVGINGRRVESVAYVLSATIAGFAGTAFAYLNGYVSPGTLSLARSGDALLAVILGGTAAVIGPVLGSVVIEGIRFLGGDYTDQWMTVLGLLYIAVALATRQRLRRLAGWVGYRPAASAPPPGGEQDAGPEPPDIPPVDDASVPTAVPRAEPR